MAKPRAPAHPSYIQPVFQPEDSPLLMTYLESQETLTEYYIRETTRCNDWSFSNLGDDRFQHPLMIDHCLLNGLPNTQQWLWVKEDYEHLVHENEDGKLVPNEDGWKVEDHFISSTKILRKDLEEAAKRLDKVKLQRTAGS